MIYYNFNLSGEGVQVSMLSQSEREIFVFKRFEARASRIAKYYASKHDMSVEECTSFMTSAMYNKFIDLRSKEIKKHGLHYNALDYLCMIKVFSQLKIAHNRANYTQAGEYVEKSACYVPDTEITVKASEGVKAYTIKGRYIAESTELQNRTDNRLIGKCFDYVDVCTMWDNRHARHEAKLARALENINSLTSVYEFTTDKHYLTMTTEERERAKKALNKQLHADAVRYNSIRYLTTLSGNYGTPETALLNKCALMRARKLITRIYNETQSGARIIDIISSGRAQTPAERRAICDFRKHHGKMFDMMDYLEERLADEN
jgi:hypothetical protein